MHTYTFGCKYIFICSIIFLIGYLLSLLELYFISIYVSIYLYECMHTPKYCISSRSDSQQQKKQAHHDLVIHRKETDVQWEYPADVEFPEVLCSQHISVLFLYFRILYFCIFFTSKQATDICLCIKVYDLCEYMNLWLCRNSLLNLWQQFSFFSAVAVINKCCYLFSSPKKKETKIWIDISNMKVVVS